MKIIIFISDLGRLTDEDYNIYIRSRSVNRLISIQSNIFLHKFTPSSFLNVYPSLSACIHAFCLYLQKICIQYLLYFYPYIIPATRLSKQNFYLSKKTRITDIDFTENINLLQNRDFICKTFAQFFAFVALRFCAKKQHFAQLFANFISRKVVLFRFCVILFCAILRNKFSVKG